MANLISGLGGDAGFGENSLVRNDDASTDYVDVTEIFENGLNFFGTTYTGFWINNNGGVTFAGPRSGFTPESIVSETNNPEITAFYADIDTNGGLTSATAGGTSTGSNLVYWDFDTANDTMVITWDDVGYYSSHTDLSNAFQIVLSDLSNAAGAAPGDFRIEFRYEEINWTTGDASGGAGGFGGTVARAGFSAGQGTAASFFELPQSGDEEAMLSLETDTGNTGVAGLWRFDVSSGDIAPIVSIESTTGAAREGTGVNQPFIFTVTRSGDLTQELTVDYVVNSTGGANGADPDDLVGGLPLTGAFRGGSVTFAPGQSVATIELLAAGDGAVEGNENFIVTLTGTSLPDVAFGQQQASATILNDDGLAPTIPATWTTSWTFGDPHLTTLDGVNYDFQAVGEFIFAESTNGAPLNVQIRTAAVGEVVSATTALATDVDGVRVTYDVASNVLTVGGVATTIDPSVGFVDVGGGRIYQDASGAFQITYSDNLSALFFADRGNYIDLSLALDPSRAGDVQGLVGNFDGNVANDLALRDGTVLSQPLSFADLYGSFAGSWRISDVESLFDYATGQSTADFTDLSFPAQQVTLDQFPTELVDAARALALANGITNPILQDAAVLDFLLTGDSAYIESATIVTEPTVEAEIADAPVASIVGIGAVIASQDERDGGTTNFAVTFYRSSSEGSLEVSFAVDAGETDGDDFVGGALPSGSVRFNDGETELTVQIPVSGDMIAEFSETFSVVITASPEGVLVASPRVNLTIVNDDDLPPPAISVSGPASVTEGTGGTTLVTYTLTRTGDTTGTTSVEVSAQAAPVTNTATATDFDGGVFPSETIVFGPGQVERTFTVAIATDALLEANETYRVAIGTIVNGTVSAGFAPTVILNDDAGVAPVADDDAYAVNEDSVLTTGLINTVLRNDENAGGGTLAASIVTGPANGTLSFESNGAFRYVPDANFAGTDSFVYSASNGLLSDNATVTITVNNINDAPVATDKDNFTAQFNTQFFLPIGLVLGGSTDADGDVLQISQVGNAENGTVTINNRFVIFTPTDGYSGPASYEYTISDGKGGFDVGKVSLIVQPQGNQAPVGQDDEYRVSENGVLVVTAANGVLLNDGDPDGDAITAFIFDEETQGPLHGTLVLSPDGSFTYTPDAGFSGADSFLYTISDGEDAGVAGVTIFVDAEENSAPENIRLSRTTLSEDTPQWTTLGLFSATDLDGDTLTYSLVDNDGGQFAIRGQRLITADTFDFESASSHQITVAVSDGTTTVEKDFTITVTDVDETPPDLAPTSLAFSRTSVSENVAIGTSVGLLSAFDPEGGTIRWALTDDADGTFRLFGRKLMTKDDIDFEETPTLSFTAQATDHAGNTTSQEFTLTVRDLAELPLFAATATGGDAGFLL